MLVHFRERTIASFDKIVIKSGVGVLWWTNGHIGKVQTFYRVGGDRGGNRRLLPLMVGLCDEESSNDEPKTYNPTPNNL